MVSSPPEDPLEERKPGRVPDNLQKIHLVFLFLYAHLVKNLVMLANAQTVKTIDHEEILANVPALQLAREKVRHEPPDEMATQTNQLADHVVFDLVPARDGNPVLTHDGQDVLPVIPFVHLDLTDGLPFLLVPNRGGVPNVSESGGLLGGVRLAERVRQLGILKLHGSKS